MMPEGQRGPLKGKRKEPEEGWSAGQQETPNDGRRAGRSETEGKLSRRDGRWDMDWRGRESKEYANWGAGMTEGQEKASISMPMMQEVFVEGNEMQGAGVQMTDRKVTQEALMTREDVEVAGCVERQCEKSATGKRTWEDGGHGGRNREWCEKLARGKMSRREEEKVGPPDCQMAELGGSLAAKGGGSEAEIGSCTTAPISALFPVLRQAMTKREGEEEQQVGEPGDHSNGENTDNVDLEEVHEGDQTGMRGDEVVPDGRAELKGVSRDDGKRARDKMTLMTEGRPRREATKERTLRVMREVTGAGWPGAMKQEMLQWLQNRSILRIVDAKKAERIVAGGGADVFAVGLVAAVIQVIPGDRGEKLLDALVQDSETERRGRAKLVALVEAAWTDMAATAGMQAWGRKELLRGLRRPMEVDECLQQVEEQARELVCALTLAVMAREGCAERRATGTLCPQACLCGNRLPEGVRRGGCEGYVVTTVAADLRQLEVVALKVFEKGEVIATFGAAATLPEKQGGSEMAALIASRKLEPGRTQYQYTFAKHMDGRGELHVVPEHDVALALQDQGSSRELKKRLKSAPRSPGGHGQLVNHTCCMKHRNSEIELRRTSEEDDAKIIACVVATRRVERAETILTSYTETGGCEGLPFVCSCCFCCGGCGHNAKQLISSRDDFATMVKRCHGQQMPALTEWEWVVGAPVGIGEMREGGMVWVGREGPDRAVWREFSKRTTREIKELCPPHKAEWILDAGSMKRLVPAGMRAGEGIRDGSFVYRPRILRYGSVVALAPDGENCTVQVESGDGRKELWELPRWRLQLEGKKRVILEADRAQVLCSDIAAIAKKDGMIGTDIVLVALQMVLTGTRERAGLAPVNTAGVQVCEPVSLMEKGEMIEEWNVTILRRPLQACRRVFLAVNIPQHWMLVEVLPREGRAVILDPSMEYSARYKEAVKALLGKWLKGVQKKWKEPTTNWSIEEEEWTQQPAGSLMCAPYTVMYAAHRLRGWQPPRDIDGMALRGWLAKMLTEESQELLRSVCRKCGEPRQWTEQEMAMGNCECIGHCESADQAPREVVPKAAREERTGEVHWARRAQLEQERVKAERREAGDGAGAKTGASPGNWRPTSVQEEVGNEGREKRTKRELTSGEKRCMLAAKQQAGGGRETAQRAVGKMARGRQQKDKRMEKKSTAGSKKSADPGLRMMTDLFSQKEAGKVGNRLPIFAAVERGEELAEAGESMRVGASARQGGEGLLGRLREEPEGESRMPEMVEATGRNRGREPNSPRRLAVAEEKCELQKVQEARGEGASEKIRRSIEREQQLEAMRSRGRARVDIWEKSSTVEGKILVEKVRGMWGRIEKQAEGMQGARVPNHREEYEATERVARRVWQELQPFGARRRKGCFRCGGEHQIKECRARQSREEKEGLPRAQWPRQAIADGMQETAVCPEYQWDGAIPDSIMTSVRQGKHFTKILATWEHEVWRTKRGERMWAEIRCDKEVVLLLEHVAMPRGCKSVDIVKRLTRLGIKNVDEWQSMELTETRSQGGLRLRNNLARVTVQVSEALRQLITGETTVQEPGEMIPMVRVQPGERNGEKRLLQSHLTVNSGRDRQRLAGWPKILKLLGAEEAHIMALTELAVELEAWQEEPNDHGIIKAPGIPKQVMAVDAHWHEKPRCMETIWGQAASSGMSGELRVMAKIEVEPAECEEYYKRCGVAGEREFLCRKADIIHPGRTRGGVLSVEYAQSIGIRKQEVWIGMPAVGKVERWQERQTEGRLGREGEWLERTRALAAAVPEGLKHAGAKTVWKVKPVMSEQERTSEMYIRFQQVRQPSRVRSMDVSAIRREVLQLVQMVQRGVCPDATRLEMADLQFAGYQNEAGLLQGTISISQGRATESEDRCRIGLVVAFLLDGKRVSEATRAFKWCPVARNPGETTCVVQSVTRATGWERLQRTKIDVALLMDGESELQREIVERLSGKTAPESEWQVMRGLRQGRGAKARPVVQLQGDDEHAPRMEQWATRRSVSLVLLDVPKEADTADVCDALAAMNCYILGIRLGQGKALDRRGGACKVWFSHPSDCDAVLAESVRKPVWVRGCKVRVVEDQQGGGQRTVEAREGGGIVCYRDVQDGEHDKPCIHGGCNGRVLWEDEDGDVADGFFREVLVDGCWQLEEVETGLSPLYLNSGDTCGVCGTVGRTANGLQHEQSRSQKSGKDKLGNWDERGGCTCRWFLQADQRRRKSAREDKECREQGDGRLREPPASGLGVETAKMLVGSGVLGLARSRAEELKSQGRMGFWQRHKFALAQQMGWSDVGAWVRQGNFQRGQGGNREWDQHEAFRVATLHRRKVAGLAWKDAGGVTLGLKWERIGKERPLHGRELNNPGLALALRGQREFELEEWEAFAITDLGHDSVILSDHVFYKPAAVRPMLGGREICNPELAEAINSKGMLTGAERRALESGEIFEGDYVRHEQRFFIPDEAEDSEVDWMQEMRADGLGILACEAEEIQRASEDAGSRQIGAERSGKKLAAERGELRSSIKQRKAAWLEMLMTCAGWKRSKCKGNVISWNLGPCGLEQAKQEIRKTLQMGAAVVMIQELRFPYGARHRIRRELRELDLNYTVHVETGPVRRGERRASRNSWSADHAGAVATFLHREAFNVTKTRHRAWYQQAQREGLAHMVQGRAQWLDVVTVDGKSVFLVNLHQATSADGTIQKLTLDCLEQAIKAREHEYGILGGDLNAGMARALAWTEAAEQHRVEGIEFIGEAVKARLTASKEFTRKEWDDLNLPHVTAWHRVRVGDSWLRPTVIEKARFGYADSARTRNEEADCRLGSFVQATGGTLVSPASPSRAGQRDLTESKLDHVIVWNLKTQSAEGTAEWVGAASQDHARVQYEVGTEVLGHSRCKARRPWQHKPSKRIQNAEAIKPLVDERCRESAEELLRSIERGERDVGEGKDECLERRLRISLSIEDKTGESHCKQRMGSKLPHRNKEQVSLRKELMVTAAALKGMKRTTGAQRQCIAIADRECLRMAGLGHLEVKLSAAELLKLTQNEEWQQGIQGLQDMLREQMLSITKRQTEIQRKRMDAECCRRMREVPGSWGEFTGKTAAKPIQTELCMPVLRGFIGGISRTPEDVRSWMDWREEMKRRVPTAKIKTYGPTTKTLRVRRSVGTEDDLGRAIRAAKASIDGVVGLEWKMAKGAQTEAMKGRMRAGEEISRAVQADPEQALRGGAPVEAWLALEPQAVVQQGEVFYQQQKRPASEVDGEVLGQFMMSSGRHYQTEEYEMWIVEHEEAESLLVEWAMMLKQAGRAIGLEVEADMLTELASEKIMVSVIASKHVDTPSIMEGGRSLGGCLQWRMPVLEQGPWTEDNMETAWEIHFEKDGYSPYARCEDRRCKASPPLVAVRIPEGMRVQGRNGRQVIPSCERKAVSEQRRELCAFCSQCWKFANFRTNKSMVGDGQFMEELGVFQERQARSCDGGLRGELTEGEFKAYIKTRLRNNKAPGPDNFQNELIKTMTDTELRILRLWANEVLCGRRRLTEGELNGTISLLHKGGDTLNAPSDFRPVVLLNSANQLVSHVINYRLKNIVERAGILEAGQGGYRQGRSTDVNMRKIERITTMAQRTKQRFLRVDVDFRNAYNSMSQPALWDILRKFGIPDVDFLESIYDKASVRLAPNDCRNASITFDTGVCQGSVLSPLLFILFINALARALTATGKNKGIAHGMQDVDQFNNLAFCDDMSIFAQNEKGMQQLLEVVEKFEQWSGIRVNLKKTIVMAVDGMESRRRTAVRVAYRGKPIRQLQETEACRYLGFWATPNGDFRHTKALVLQRTKEAIELIQHHPYSPEMATQIFISKGVGSFRYSAMVVQWSDEELRKLRSMWIQGFRTAWHLGQFTAATPFVLPAECGGLELITPKAILAQVLTAHIQRCMLHDDVVHSALVSEFEMAKAHSLCTSFEDMWEEMDLWRWEEAQGNIWLRTAKCLRELRMELDVPPSLETKEEGGMGWAQATRTLRRAFQRVRQIGGKAATTSSKDRGTTRWNEEMWRLTPGGVGGWGMETADWQALEEGMAAFWTAGRRLWQAGKGQVALMEQRHGLKRLQVPAGLRATAETDGQQAIRVVIPRGMAGIAEECRAKFQRFLDLVDWKGMNVAMASRQGHRATDVRPETCLRCDTRKFRCQPCPNPECSSGAMTLAWLAKMNAEEAGGQELTELESVGEIADRLTNLETGKNEADLRSLELSVGRQPEVFFKGVWRWLATRGARERLRTSVEVEREGGLQVLECVWPMVLGKLHPLRSREWAVQLEEVTEMVRRGQKERDRQSKVKMEAGAQKQSTSQWDQELRRCIDRINGQCANCQAKSVARCVACDLQWCSWCEGSDQACKGCGESKDRGPSLGKRQPKRKAGQRLGRNMHNMGQVFIEQVTGVRRRAVANPDEISVDERVEFEGRVRGWRSQTRVSQLQALLGKSDDQLIEALVQMEGQVVLFIPQNMFSKAGDGVEFGDKGWWYVATREGQLVQCTGCRELRHVDQFAVEKGRRQARCELCMQKAAKKRKVETKKTAKKGVQKAAKKRKVEPKKAARKGVVCMTADPRYAGREDERSGGDVLLDAGRLRKVLEAMIALEESEMTVWLTTKEMGYALEAESDELIEERDEREGRRTGRWIAPQIESFIRGIENGPRTTADGEDQGDATLQEELRIMLADWCSPNEKGKPKEGERVRQLVMRWESESEPLMAKEPRVLEDVDVELEIGEGWFFNQAVPRHCSGKGYVRVMSEPVKWTEEGLGMQILNVEGRVASLDPKHPWTITSAQWNSLKAKTGMGQGGYAQGRDLVERLYEESQVQERLERQGVRCMTWRVLRSLQAVFEATTLQGGTMVTAAPFFDAARRGKVCFWGRGEGPEVVLWDTLDEQEKAEWKETNGNRRDYIVVRRARGRARQQEAETGLEPPGQRILKLGRAAGGAEQQDEEIGREAPRSRGQRAFGWWKRGDVQATLNEHGIECWVHQKLTKERIGTDRLQMIESSWQCEVEKDECQLRLNEREAHYWLGTEPGQLGIIGFQGMVAAADGSDSKGKMGAGFCTLDMRQPGEMWEEVTAEKLLRGREIFYNDLARVINHGHCPSELHAARLELMGVTYGDYIKVKDKIYTPSDGRRRGWARIGREEEGTSSFRAELAALLMLLREAPDGEDVVALLDCKSEITEVGKWIGEGAKATLVGVANADILEKIIEKLRARIQAGAATFLVKVKAHRGEPLNEEADDCADIGRLQDADTKEWTDRTERLIFRWQTADGVKRKNAWGASVRIALRKQGAWAMYRTHMTAGGRKWSEDNWMGPDLCGRAPAEAVREEVKGLWFDNLDVWMEKCTEQRRNGQEGEKKGQRSPATDSWTADFMTRKGESRECIHKWLKCRSIPWKRRRRLIQVLTGTFPCGQWLNKIGRGQGKGCALCSRKRAEGCQMGKRESESVGHIQSAYCEGQKEVVTAAHNRCNRFLQREVQRLVKEVEVLTEEHEESMKGLWEREELREVCPWSELAEVAWQQREEGPPSSRCVGKRDQDGELRQAGTPRRDVRQDVDGDRREDNCGMLNTCEVCAAECQRGGGKPAGEGRCCHCMRKAGDVFEEGESCKICWIRELGARRFDGVALNRETKTVFTLEFKRTSDREHGYAQRCDERATKQYASLIRAAHQVAQQAGWTILQVNFVAGLTSVNVERFEKALETLGVPKQKWAQVRTKFMRVLLEEHDNILRSYQAQKHGGGDGMGAIGGQRMDLGLGPV